MWVSILCATLAAYLPALRGGLLWDDSTHVTIPELRSLHGLWRIWFDLGATQQYYPLLHSAFWLEHRVWGDAVLGYHLTNVILHAASACLVVTIVRRLSLPGAWLAGLIFALHPVCVESVAWISEQKSTLSAVFYLGAALAYLRFDRTRRAAHYWPAMALFALALLSKTVTATLPGALLVMFWWQRGRIEWKRDVQPLLPWFALGASAGLFTAWVERTVIGAEGADFTLTLFERCLLAGRAIWFYAGKLVWPSNLTFFYPRWTIDPGEWWQYLFPAGVLALAIGLWLVRRRHRGPLAGFLIFAGTLFPVLGFFNVYPFRFSYVADHFQYLASLGIIVPVTSAVAVLARRISADKLVRAGIGAVFLALLGVLTWGQSGMYRDAETLYAETAARNPGSWLAHNNLGTILLGIPGRLADAITEYQAAVRLEPGSERAHSNLGNALAQAGRLREAIPELETALRIKPGYAEGHNNLGFALAQMPGGMADAIAEYQAALRITPDFAEAHYNLGNAFSEMPGRLPDAIAEYQAALRTGADLPEAHNNLGGALAQTPGRLPDAIAQFEAAIRLRPNYLEAHNNRGNALSQIPGRLPDAIAEYQTVLGVEPDNLEAHLGLGNALSQTPGRLAEAVAEYEAVLRIKPDPELREMVERLKAGGR
jgi:tetratricopeptide (TPR) repeat protein